MEFIRDNYKSKIFTSRGIVETPNFIFCATKGAIKGTLPNFLGNQQIILANTFHLMNHAENINNMGGLHRCMGWHRPLLTDSGGFQVFSLGHGSVANEIKGIRNGKSSMVKINEEGCFFKDIKNGQPLFLGPEKSFKIQYLLGVDFLVTFDECTPYHSSYEYIYHSLLRTNRWQDRFLGESTKHDMTNRGIYGILQGGTHKELRDISIEYLKSKDDFFGYAIGGTLGKNKEEMYDIVKYISGKLGRNKPIHLLGIGEIDDILHLCRYVDTFDCVEPTRIARHGVALTKMGKKKITNSKFYGSDQPLDPSCNCYSCKSTTEGFIHYLFKAKEMAAMEYLIVHNIHTMQQLMLDIQNTINHDNLLEQTRLKWAKASGNY